MRLLEGRDTQHVLDAIFKALGVALAQACRPQPKGVADGREVRCPHRRRARTVPGRAVLAGRSLRRPRLRRGPGRAAAGPRRRSSATTIEEQTEQACENLQAILEAAGSSFDKVVKTTVYLTDFGDFPEMNEVYGRYVGDKPPARATSQVADAADGRAGRDRGGRARLSRPIDGASSTRSASTRTSSAAPCATSCSGDEAKDQDFVVPGRATTSSRDALAPHGRVEDLEVAGRARRAAALPARPRAARARAGRDRVRAAAARALDRARAARLRDRRVDPAISLEEDMARRDFTINAIAKRLATGELLDPFDGRAGPRGHGCCARCRRELSRGPAAARPRPALRLAARSRAGRGDARADARGGAVGPARLGRADRRRAHGRRDGRALEAPARPAPGEGAAARARHRRARRRCSPSSRRRSGSTSRRRGSPTRSTSTSSRSCRRRPTPGCRSRFGSPRCCTTSASRRRTGVTRI